MFEEVCSFGELPSVRGSVVVLDAVLVEVEPFEVGLVEQASRLVVAVVVEAVGVTDEIEVTAQDLCADLEPLVGAGEGLVDAVAFGGDGAQPGLDLVGGHGAVGGEVEESFLPPIEVCEALALPCSEFGGERLRLTERSGELVGEVVAERCWCGEVGVVGGDGGFDVGDREVWQVAGAVLSSSTQVVVVGAAAAVGAGEDEPVGASGLVAAFAPEQPFEVVLVDAVP